MSLPATSDDRPYAWYRAMSVDSDTWFDPLPTRDEAIAAGMAEYGAMAQDLDGQFAIVQARKMRVCFDNLFDGEDNEDLGPDEFTITFEALCERLESGNEDCWEDAMEWSLAEPLRQDLVAEVEEAQAFTTGRAAAMSRAFEGWCLNHRDALPEGYMLDIKTSEEVHIPKAGVA